MNKDDYRVSTGTFGSNNVGLSSFYICLKGFASDDFLPSL